MFIYFEVFFIDGRSRIRHKQVSWPLFKEPVYLEKSTKKPQSLRKTNAAKWKIEKRTAISGCRVQFFLYGRLLFTHALWRANCPSSLDWLMGPSFFFFFLFREKYIQKLYVPSEWLNCLPSVMDTAIYFIGKVWKTERRAECNGGHFNQLFCLDMWYFAKEYRARSRAPSVIMIVIFICSIGVLNDCK